MWETLFRPAVGKLLTVLGFVGGAGVALAVQMATPSWFDPGEACQERFGGNEFGHLTSYRVDEQFFPPRATCVASTGARYDYLGLGDSTVLAGLMVASWLVFLVGLVSVTRNWLRADDRPAPARRSGSNHFALRTPLNVLAAAAIGVLVALAAGQLLVSVLIFGTSALIGVWALLAPAAALAAAGIDDRLGGGRDGRRGSRRRGLLVGGLGSTAILFGGVLGYLTDVIEVTPLGPGWIFLAAAVPCAVLAAVVPSRNRT